VKLRRRGASRPFTNELAELRAQVAELRAAQVGMVQATVTGTGPGTFNVAIPGQVDGVTTPLNGIASPEQFMPDAGDLVQLLVAGAQPLYQPGTIAENAITSREIQPGTITETELAFTLEELGGGTNVFYGSTTPTSPVVGDLWVKVIGQTAGVDQHETRRWDGDSWELLADQRTTQALLDAAAAQTAASQANQKGIDALAAAATAQGAANTAQGTANTAQSTANAKTTNFQQTTAPTATGRVVGDTWDDTDDGNRRYYWNGTAWTNEPLGATGISATARQLGGLTIYRQASAPTTGVLDGDYWVDSDDGKPYVRVAGVWTLSQDADINTAITNAATAQATADLKVRVFAQASAPTGLTAADDGDVWIETDSGNTQYIWQSTGTVQRTNYALNPSFESQAAGTVTAHDGWDTGGVGAGTVTKSIATTAPVSGTRVGRLVGSSLAIATTNSLYMRQVFAANSGDVLRIAGTAAVTVAGTAFPVELLVEWLNATGTLVGSGSTLGTGAVGNQSLVYTSPTLPAGVTQVRVTFRRRGTGTGTALVNADLNLDAVLFERNRPANAPTVYFDGNTGGEARWVGQAYLSASTTWVEGTTGGYAWQPRLLRTGAFQPGSIVASSVIATGTISAALLEALMVLTTVLIAGDPNGVHVRIDPNGVVAYVSDPNDATPNEVARFGQTSGGRDPVTGKLLWQIDQTGVGSFAGLSSTADPTFQGTKLSTRFDQKCQIVAWTFKWPSPGFTSNELGLVELSWQAKAGHAYLIQAWGLIADVDGVGDATETTVPFRFRATFNGATPTTGSQLMAMGQATARFDSYPWENPTTSVMSLHHAGTAQTVRYLLTIAKPTAVGSTVKYWDDFTTVTPFMWVLDLGISPGDTGIKNTGGGTIVGTGTAAAPATPKQDSEIILDCNWSQSYHGDTNAQLPYGEAYQGYNPAYPLGNTRSFIGFPDMTAQLSGATIRYMKVYLWYGFWYRYDGGYPQVGVHANLTKPSTATGQLALGPAPTPWVARGQGLWIDLPSSWWGGFQTGAHRGIALGPATSTDGGYAGRANGWNQPEFPRLAIGITK
jgi:hypothetical protein